MVALGLALLSSSANAAVATADASISVIVSEISITKQRDMDLGVVAKPSNGVYTVTLAPSGTRTGVGGSGGAVIGGPGTTATFNVTGDGQRDFTVSTPASITLSLAGGGPGREVAFAPSHAEVDNTGGALGGPSTKLIEVGGALSVPADVEVGAYTASLPVSVDYQ